MADTKISALTAATTPLAGTEVLPIVQGGVTKQVSVANLTAGRSITSSKLEASGSGELLKLITSGNVTSGGLAYLRFYDSVGARGYVGYVGTGALQITGSGDVELQPASGSNVLLTGANIVQGTAAKGFNFTANSAAAGMTSQLLNWYEQGTFTPVVASSGGGTATYVRQIGRYTRIGNRVFFQIEVDLATKGTLAAGYLTLTGLPYTSDSTVANWGVASPGICDGFTYPAGANQLTAVIDYNSAVVGLYWLKSGASTINVVIADISATARISFGGHYMV